MLTSEELSRRRFLGFGAAAAASLAFLGRADAQYSGVPGKDSIIISENGETPVQLVAGAFEALGGIRGFISPGDVVLVKPNASFSSGPDIGANTNPEIVSAVTSLCLETGADRVILADHTVRKPGRIIVESNGLRQAAEECGGEFVVLDRKSDFETVEIEGRSLKSVDVAKLISQSDVLINLPVLKQHHATGACAGMKNLMGLVYDRGIFHREGLWTTIADLSLAVKPDLTIVDATKVMTKNGPGGEPDPGQEYLNRVVAGVDPVAVDVAALSMVSSLGYPDFEINSNRNAYIRFASDLGVGEGDPSTVEQNTFIFDATEGDAKCIVKQEGLEVPDWAPYAMLSGASIALGGAAILYDRRIRDGAKKR
jgi:uncharacterized protein (DUF362 family)